jgi:hypothetical protein
MNTWIWGPPTWKVLHTLSFSPRCAEYATEVSTFLFALGHVLPCVFCRDSYNDYARQLEEISVMSLRDTIRASALSSWMYKLHEMVNDKLNYQALNELHVDPSMITLLHKRQISLQCLTKRFIVRPIAFCDGDVWDMLKYFALNMDNRIEKGDVRREHPDLIGWYTFIQLLPLMITIAGGSPSLVRRLSMLPPLVLARERPFFDIVGQNCCSTPHSDDVYKLAMARECKDGSCK